MKYRGKYFTLKGDIKIALLLLVLFRKHFAFVCGKLRSGNFIL